MKNGSSAQTQEVERLKVREKLSFGVLVMSAAPLNGLASGYLLLFYTTIIGLDPIAVGTLFLIARIVDGISDPIMGYFIDHIKNSKFGKYRFLMMIGSFICGINFLLVWFGPLWAPAGKMAIAYVTYLIFGFTFDLMDVSKNSIMPTITSNTDDIVSLGKYNSLCNLLAGLVVSVGAPIILGNERTLKSYVIVIVGTIAFSVLTANLGAAGVKQRITAVKKDEKHTLKDYLKLFANKPVVALLLYALLFTMSTMLTTGVNTLYFTYVLHDLPSLAAVSMLQLVGIIPGVLLAGVFIRKFGEKKVFLLSAVVMAAFCMIRMLDPYSLALVIVSTLGNGFVLGAYQPAGSVVGVGNIDYLEHKTGYRAEAALASMNTFFAKVSIGIAGAIPGFLLGLCGFVQDSDVQPDSVVNMLIILATVVPAVTVLLGGVLFQVLYKVKPEELASIRGELEKKRAEQ